MSTDLIKSFVAESNLIEGIKRDPTAAEIERTMEFLARPLLGLDDFRLLVATFAPAAVLRDSDGLDVGVGDYIAPPGGPAVRSGLVELIGRANRAWPCDAWRFHCAYEHLHPFTDGNGRSGRALWAWLVVREGGLGVLRHGFLRPFYYQTLAAADVMLDDVAMAVAANASFAARDG